MTHMKKKKKKKKREKRILSLHKIENFNNLYAVFIQLLALVL